MPVIGRIRGCVVSVLALMKHDIKLPIERIGDGHSVVQVRGVTSLFHGGNMGFNPLGNASFINNLDSSTGTGVLEVCRLFFPGRA